MEYPALRRATTAFPDSGLPLPDSSCDSVDFAIPARRATSASESPVRARSRTRLLAITLIGCVTTRPLFFISNNSFALKNDHYMFIIMEIRSIWLSDMKQTLSSLSGDTIKAIVLVCLAVGVVGMSLWVAGGGLRLPLWVPLLLSVSVLAGASEFMFIGIVASGGSPLAAAAAGLLVNARHIRPARGDRTRTGWSARLKLYRVPHCERRERGLWLVAAHPAQRKAAYWLCGAGVALIWPPRYANRRGRRQTAASAGNHRA